MTTVASIINSAFRETNLIPISVLPTQPQLDEAFALLSTIVAGVLGNEAGENLNPMPLGQNAINSPKGYPWWSNQLPGNLFIPVNTRLMCNLTGPGTVNLSPAPHDGARMGIVDVSNNFATYPLTVLGNGRNIEGATFMVYNVNGTIRQWLYREDQGNWVTVLPLDATGSMPWPSEFDDIFIIMLAMRLNPRNGASMNPASIEALKSGMTKFSARYGQSTIQMPSEQGLIRTANNYGYWGQYSMMYGDPNTAFNTGFIF